MKLINKKRQTGKTTGLIYTSEATGYSIIVNTEEERRYINKAVEKMGCTIPPVYLVEEVRNGMKGTSPIDKTAGCKFLLDDCEKILAKALESYLNCELFAATLSIDNQPPKQFGIEDVGKSYSAEVVQNYESDYASKVKSANISSQLDTSDDSDIDSLLNNTKDIIDKGRRSLMSRGK